MWAREANLSQTTAAPALDPFGYATHDVLNQPPPLADYDAFGSDPVLQKIVNAFGAGWARDRLHETASGFGLLTAVRHAAEMSETPPHWARGSVPLGTHAPAWSS